MPIKHLPPSPHTKRRKAASPVLIATPSEKQKGGRRVSPFPRSKEQPMMAGRSHHHLQAAATATKKHAPYRLFVAPVVAAAGDDADEFTESDIWGCSVEPAPDQHRGRAFPPARSKRPAPAPGDHLAAAASMPVTIPDWSKILGSCADSSCHSKNSGFCWADDEEEEEEELLEDGRRRRQMVPPHELLWRTRGASMSVHEGIGRTLKGRDLRRVRNAVWEITGFED